jgi:hypothetical protein
MLKHGRAPFPLHAFAHEKHSLITTDLLIAATLAKQFLLWRNQEPIDGASRSMLQSFYKDGTPGSSL